MTELQALFGTLTAAQLADRLRTPVGGPLKPVSLAGVLDPHMAPLEASFDDCGTACGGGGCSGCASCASCASCSSCSSCSCSCSGGCSCGCGCG